MREGPFGLEPGPQPEGKKKSSTSLLEWQNNLAQHSLKEKNLSQPRLKVKIIYPNPGRLKAKKI